MIRKCGVLLTVLAWVSVSMGCATEKESGSEKKVVAPIKKAADSPKPDKPKKATPSKKAAGLEKTGTEGDQTVAPEKFAVKLTTTQGDIVIDIERQWAPKGADRFFTLVKNGYFADVAFFRVIKGFMAQTGISGDPAVNSQWRKKRIPDDPVEQSNKRGYVSFATSGPNSRTTQFFINFGDNGRLDKMGFAPFGKVRDMNIVDKLYDGYGEGAPRGKGPSQSRIQREGNTYLKKDFPKMDYIKSAEILPAQ